MNLLEDITSDTKEKALKDLNDSIQRDSTAEQQAVKELNSNIDFFKPMKRQEENVTMRVL